MAAAGCKDGHRGRDWQCGFSVLTVPEVTRTMSTTKDVELRRMWDGGPLRRWSPKPPFEGRAGSWMTHAGAIGGYVASSYVCEECREWTVGVYYYGGKWVCEGCKNKL
jgi:hypothetical protein